MLGTRTLRRGVTWLALLNVAFSLRPLETQAQNPQAAAPLAGEVVPIVAPRSSLEISERFTRVLEFPVNILRVDGFDPSVLSITALSPTSIRVQTLDQGVTTMVVAGDRDQNYTIEVYVSGDARLLQAVLKRHFPNTAVQVSRVRNNILLRGWVAEPHQINEIVDIARLYGAEVLNQMKVAGPQDVQLRVKILEAQRSAIRRFGINFSAVGRNATVISTPGPISPLSTLTLPFGGPPAATFADAGLANTSLALGIATDNFVFEGLIQALKEEGLLKISAEPVLITRSGEGARLINGGEFPIPVPQSLGTVTIEWREFGVLLESLPIVLGPTTLKQQIKAEVSERDFTTAVTLNGTTVPGLTKRTVETQTVMEFGQTLVIGGLIATRYTAETDKIPFLGELPGIGAAFRRTRYDIAETELIVMITPEYVSPLNADQLPPGGPGKSSAVPTDRELYGHGVIEVPNYGEPCQGPDCQPGGMGGWTAPGISPAPAPVLVPTPAPMTPPPPAPTATRPDAGAEAGLITPSSTLPPPPPGDPSVSTWRRTGFSAAPTGATKPLPMANRATARTTPAAPQRDYVAPVGYRFDEAASGTISPAAATTTAPTGK
jgi:pilus assembly protein CpaC